MTSVNDGAAALGSGPAANHTLLIGQPYASPSATTLVFSSESPGQDSSSLTETITDNGITPLAIGTDTIIGGDGDQFRITGDGCAGTTIKPGATCNIGVRYEALVTGTPAATLRINSNSPTSPSLVTLDPPGAAAATPHNLTCHFVRVIRRAATVKCTGKPRLPETGVGSVHLLRGTATVGTASGHLRHRLLTARFTLKHRLHRGTYRVQIEVAGADRRGRIRF